MEGAEAEPEAITPRLLTRYARGGDREAQRAAAEVLGRGEPTAPVLLQPRLAAPLRTGLGLDLSTSAGALLGHVRLASVSGSLEVARPWLLVGEVSPGEPVALVSTDGRSVLLPASALRAGSAPADDFSDEACAVLGWRSAGNPLPGRLPTSGRVSAAEAGSFERDPRLMAAAARHANLALATMVLWVPLVAAAVVLGAPFLGVLGAMAVGLAVGYALLHRSERRMAALLDEAGPRTGDPEVGARSRTITGALALWGERRGDRDPPYDGPIGVAAGGGPPVGPEADPDAGEPPLS